MQVFGHRGAAGYCPENSLPSIRKALELGVDGVEFDVRVTRDRIPVVIHDESIDRTTDASGLVKQLSLSELNQLLPQRKEYVPTLEDVLREIGTTVRINVELKEIEVCEPTIAILGSLCGQNVISCDQILISSFDLDAVERFSGLVQDYAFALLTERTPEKGFWSRAKTVQAVAANIDLTSVDRKFIDLAHASQLEVMVYTVNTLEDARRMKRLGVDAIFSDFPDRVRS